MPSTITATPEAQAALASLRADHGEIILHVTGGWCANTSLVLAKNDLALGPRDGLIGTVEGVPVYQMAQPGVPAYPCYVLDLIDGLPMGFSIVVAPGKQFRLSGAG